MLFVVRVKWINGHCWFSAEHSRNSLVEVAICILLKNYLNLTCCIVCMHECMYACMCLISHLPLLCHYRSPGKLLVEGPRCIGAQTRNGFLPFFPVSTFNGAMSNPISIPQEYLGRVVEIRRF